MFVQVRLPKDYTYTYVPTTYFPTYYPTQPQTTTPKTLFGPPAPPTAPSGPTAPTGPPKRGE